MAQKRFLLITFAILALATWATIRYGLQHSVTSSRRAAATKTTPAADNPSANTPASHIDAQLQSLVDTWTSGQAFSSSVVVEEFSGGLRSASYRQNESIVTASTFKIYVAYAVLHAVEQGKYTLGTVTSDGATIQTDLTRMIVNSDNAAARTLGFMLGWSNINALLKIQGITTTDLNNYIGSDRTPVGDKHSTAADLATALQKLQSGTLLNTTHTQLLLALMERQMYRQRIPAGVPSGVTVADKPGWLSPADGDANTVQNDAAIVYGPKSIYILVITTTGGSTQPLANLSQQIYNYLQT